MERAVILGGVSRVLLIEDDPAVREGLELALTRHGHRVRAVESGEQGLDRLRTDLPDVVVLDLMLPGMDGFEVCRRIRATGQIPIIMLTARSDDIDVVAGLEAGADDYVIKPFSPRELATRLWTVLARRSPQTVGAGFSAGMLASVALCANPRPVTLTSALGVASVASRAAGRHIA
jgi:DNA-binding response OmpR family regulator